MKRFSVLFLFSLLFLILVTPMFAVTSMISPVNSVSIGIAPDMVLVSSYTLPTAIPNGPQEVITSTATAEVPNSISLGTPANESPLYIAQHESKPFRLYNTGELRGLFANM